MLWDGIVATYNKNDKQSTYLSRLKHIFRHLSLKRHLYLKDRLFWGRRSRRGDLRGN